MNGSRVVRRLNLIVVAALGLSPILTTPTMASTPIEPVFVGDEALGNQKPLGIFPDFGVWSEGKIEWVYNPTDAPTGYDDDNYALTMLQRATDEWEDVCGIDFEYMGIDTTADLDDATDNQVVFGWSNVDMGGAAGRAGPSAYGGDQVANGHWHYVDGVLKLNQDLVTVPADETAVQTLNREENLVYLLIMHEIGHLLGLGHSDFPISIMFANPYTTMRHARSDDIDGCVAMYGDPAATAPDVTYTEAAAGSDPFQLVKFVDNSDFTTPVASIDAVDELFLYVSYEVAGPFDDTVTIDLVDPEGYLYTSNTQDIQCDAGFICTNIPNISYNPRLREQPGTWTAYTVINGQSVNTQTVDVNTALSDWNGPPAATLTIQETSNPRSVTATVDVTGDSEGDLATIVWHLPGTGEVVEELNASSGSSSQTVNLSDDADYKIFVEVNDDWEGYPLDLGE